MSTPPIPDRMKHLALWRDRIPLFFVLSRRPDGSPDFRNVNRSKQIEADKKGLCHICGKTLWPPFWFICPPNHVEQLTSIDGPMHEECARYAIVACPYLANPNYVSSRDVLDGASLGAFVYLQKQDIKGPVERPARIALCSAAKYKADHTERYCWYDVDEWLTVDWDTIPSRPDA